MAQARKRRDSPQDDRWEGRAVHDRAVGGRVGLILLGDGRAPRPGRGVADTRHPFDARIGDVGIDD